MTADGRKRTLQCRHRSAAGLMVDPFVDELADKLSTAIQRGLVEIACEARSSCCTQRNVAVVEANA